MINSLQYLRAYAAIWVLVTHVFQRLALKPFGYAFAGQWGVDVFFVLSGFIIYYVTKNGTDWKVFVVKRFFRIFPLYWICLAGYWLYYRTDFTFSTLMQNVLMMPFRDAIGYKSLIVGQAWSTCYEMYFYLIFALLLLLKMRKELVLPILGVLFVTTLALSKIGFLIQYGPMRYIYSLTSAYWILFFLGGISIGMLYNKYGNKLNIRLLWGGVIAIPCILLLAIVLFEYKLQYSLIWSLTLFSLFLLINPIIGKSNNLAGKIGVWLGDISFSIYLIHSLIIRILVDNFEIRSFGLLLVLTLIFTLIISGLTHRYIETPFINLSKRLSIKFKSHVIN